LPAGKVAVQRLRLTFSKGGPARYISHLDLARALERALNRAGLPVAYTQGFNRRPRLSLAAALPLGYTSEAELADVWLTEPAVLGPDGGASEFRRRLMGRMAPGIEVTAVVEAPLAAPSLQQSMIESHYVVRFLDLVDREALAREVEAILAAETLMRVRARPKGNQTQPFDLRPLILEMRLESEEAGQPYLWLRLVQTATQTGRPDDVLAALGLDPLDAWVHRVGLRLGPA
jgi:radical SAM-linked protein